MNKNLIKSEVLNYTGEYIKENLDSIIEGIEYDMLESDDNKGWWQVEHTLNELIGDIQGYLEDDNILDYEENLDLKDIIDYDLDGDKRREMFNILVYPVKKHFESIGYQVNVSQQWEQVDVIRD